MTEQTTAADDALNEAAAEAQDQEVQEEQTEEPQETLPELSGDELEQELPEEHKERSDLGRKLSAYHRRVDGLESKLDRIATLLESSAEKNQTSSIDEDEPLTYAEWKRLSAEEKRNEEKQQEKYRSDYDSAVINLGSSLPQDEWDGIIAEMQTMPLNSTGNPKYDAERNFYQAERAYLRKQMASARSPERKNPLKHQDKPSGVATSQKTVAKEAALPKIDGAAQSYLDMVAREDGDERAQKLRKSMA